MFTTSQFRILNLFPGQELAAARAKGERVREIPPTVGSPLQQPVLAEGRSCRRDLLPLRGLLGPPEEQRTGPHHQHSERGRTGQAKLAGGLPNLVRGRGPARHRVGGGFH